MRAVSFYFLISSHSSPRNKLMAGCSEFGSQSSVIRVVKSQFGLSWGFFFIITYVEVLF
jgi:hypothetical protein